METLIKYGFECIGGPRTVPFLLLLLTFLLKTLKTHLDKTQLQKTKRISEMLIELEKENRYAHAFRIEQVFQNAFGVPIDYPAINFFLSQSNPSKFLSNFRDGFQYVEFDNNYSKISFKKRCNVKRLRIQYWIYLIGYFVSASCSLGAIILLSIVKITSGMGFAIYLFYILSLLIFSGLCLDQTSKPLSAIDLVRMAETST